MSCPRPRSWPVTAQHLGVVRLSQFSTWLEENCHSLGSHTCETVTVTVTVQHLGLVTLSHTATLINKNTILSSLFNKPGVAGTVQQTLSPF